MVENSKKTQTNSHPIIHFPTNEGVSEVIEQVSAAEGVGEMSRLEQVNE